VHLDTQLKSAVGGVVELSTGESFESDVIVWTAGVMASPMLKNTDLPIEERGRLRVRADGRVEGDDGIVADAWGAGDVAATPDLTGGGVGGFCVPNAQHAVRQGKLMAKNLTASLRGEGITDYFHKNLGAVAGLGLYQGAFQSGKLGITGFPAWVMHRGYHGLAIPSFERKARVVTGWVNNLVWGRDIVSLEARETPRTAFETFASRPRPAADAAPAAPVKKEEAPAKKAADDKADAPTEGEKSPALAGSYSSAPSAETTDEKPSA
jgi:NADH dehydrogenase